MKVIVFTQHEQDLAGVSSFGTLCVSVSTMTFFDESSTFRSRMISLKAISVTVINASSVAAR